MQTQVLLLRTYGSAAASKSEQQQEVANAVVALKAQMAGAYDASFDPLTLVVTTGLIGGPKIDGECYSDSDAVV